MRRAQTTLARRTAWARPTARARASCPRASLPASIRPRSLSARSRATSEGQAPDGRSDAMCICSSLPSLSFLLASKLVEGVVEASLSSMGAAGSGSSKLGSGRPESDVRLRTELVPPTPSPSTLVRRMEQQQQLKEQPPPPPPPTTPADPPAAEGSSSSALEFVS
jgi:hypothetical protein